MCAAMLRPQIRSAVDYLDGIYLFKYIILVSVSLGTDHDDYFCCSLVALTDGTVLVIVHQPCRSLGSLGDTSSPLERQPLLGCRYSRPREKNYGRISNSCKGDNVTAGGSSSSMIGVSE